MDIDQVQISADGEKWDDVVLHRIRISGDQYISGLRGKGSPDKRERLMLDPEGFYIQGIFKGNLVLEPHKVKVAKIHLARDMDQEGVSGWEHYKSIFDDHEYDLDFERVEE